MRKYKVGDIITSLDELVKQKSVYQYFGYWKYMDIGWILAYQLNYVYNQLKSCRFAYAVNIEEDNNDTTTRNT